jgi:thymidylate kinase
MALPVELYKRQYKCIKEMRHELHSLTKDSALLYFSLHRVGMQDDSELLKEKLKSTSIICDRWIHSLSAYSVVKDPRVERAVSLNQDGLIVPDAAIFLTCDPVVRDDRLLSREGTPIDREKSLFLNQVQERFSKIAEKKVSTRNIVVDTTNKTPEQVSDEIMRGLFI